MDLFILSSKDMWGTSGVHSFYVPHPFYIHFYGDNAPLDPRAPCCGASYTDIIEYQLKILTFLYLGQVVLSSESDSTWSYSLSKTTILDAFFQVFLQQKGKNSSLLLWLSNQKQSRGTEVAFTCLFL